MARIFSFALGYLTEHFSGKEARVLLDFLEKMCVSGVELTFASEKRLYSFNPPAGIKKRLRRLKYVTIHAPWEPADEKKVINRLDFIAKLYVEIGAKNVIIHPNNLPATEVLKRYNFKISTENLKKKRNIAISELKKIFNKYPKIGFCLDTSHAYSWSKYETGKLIKAFKDRITQIHLSARYKGSDHVPLRKASKDFLFSIKPIKNLNVPIVIEETIKKTNLKSVRKEIEYIKKNLNS